MLYSFGPYRTIGPGMSEGGGGFSSAVWLGLLTVFAVEADVVLFEVATVDSPEVP